MRFQNRHCLVTGGASGIGRAVAELFVGEGATVTIWDQNEELGRRTLDALESRSGRPHRFDALNLADGASVRSKASDLASQAVAVDSLINCAAIAAPEAITGAFLEMPEERWRPLIEVNFIAQVRVMQAIIPQMVAAKSGVESVVNVISDSYLGHDRNLAMYGAGKAALASLTKTLARELGPMGIRVNGVSPSATATPSTEEWLSKYEERIAKLYPLRRLGKPIDQAQAIAFLASSDADWITGQILSVNGGFL